MSHQVLVMVLIFAFFLLSDAAVVDLPPLTCALALNSPQFAILCRAPFKPLEGLLNFTADGICDFDCRCTHGANLRGGRCGVPLGRNEPFCICDYGRQEARQDLLNLPCPELPNLIGNFGKIPVLGVLDFAIQPLFGAACDADCQCSHGYPDNGRHELSTKNGQMGNDKAFCICGDGETLLT